MTLRSAARRSAAVLVSVCAGCSILAASAAASTHRTTTSITSFTVSGTSSRPVFTIIGRGLTIPKPNPKASPSGQTLCPLKIAGNAGLDYGTRFYLIAWDAQANGANPFLYAGGRYRPQLSELDCIGLVVLSKKPTKVSFTLGHAYTQYYASKPRLLKNEDVIEVVLNGAAFATVARLR